MRQRNQPIPRRGRDLLRKLALWGCLLGLLLPAEAAEQPAVPPLASATSLLTGELEVEAGQEWSTQVTVPVIPPGHVPVLTLRAFAQGGGGCNYVLQVLLDDMPVGESAFRRRLLNKLPWFDPPGTDYHFSWSDSRERRWMTMFGQNDAITWGGTGRDTEFVFDLSGLVRAGQTLALGIGHAMPSLPAAIKRERAPLVISHLALGTLPETEATRLRHHVEARDGMRDVEVTTALPDEEKREPRPYELEWSGRPEGPPPQVALEDLSGWTAVADGDMDISLHASAKHRLWRRQGARLTYSGGTAPTTVLIRPPAPVPITVPFDAADLWLFPEIERMKERHPELTAHVEDARGREFSIDLGPVKNSYWVRLHGVVPRGNRARMALPARFIGLSCALFPVQAPRSLYLESLALSMRNRRPFAENTRPPSPAFPIHDDGILPDAPTDCRNEARPEGRGAVFTARTPTGTLEYRVEPEAGVLAGVRARWDSGPWFTPMAEGGIEIGAAHRGAEADTRMGACELRDGVLHATWRRSVEWSAQYRLRGFTLAIDVQCDGGGADGLRLGTVKDLPDARRIYVPYLCYGRGFGPAVACGGNLFVSTLVDWYHSDCSRVNAQVPDRTDGVALMSGTDYLPLTDGTRNDLRDRVLLTVSPEFADVLPSIPNPPSPHLRRLSPTMFFMSSYIRPSLWKTMKRHGIDHVITCDFARFYVQDFAEGFAGRWEPHPTLTMAQIQEYREQVTGLGYLFGAYSDIRDWFPLNGAWDDDCVALDSTGDLVDGWYGNFRTKPNYLPVLARLVGEKAHEHYAPESVYMDTHTCVDLTACDFEAGVPGAGIARDHVLANADCILESRKWYGSTMSEGRVRWLYAGVVDMDYASLFLPTPPADVPPLVDFDLRKIHPLNLGTMMGYGPSIFFGRGNDAAAVLYRDKGSPEAPREFYQYVAASLAYGHMLMLGYSYVPPLSRMIHLYALMQGLQVEYLPDTVAEISYHDGEGFVDTSQALLADTQKLGRVRVGYSGGLTVHVNYNGNQPWHVEGHELPPFGWLAVKTGGILAFSAVVDGSRVDCVRCPAYTYVNAPAKPFRFEELEVQGAVWLKRTEAGLRLIPCGDLGPWEPCDVPGLPAFMRDMRVKGTPGTRGCARIALDTRRLLNKPPQAVKVVARDELGNAVPANTRAGERLEISPSPEAVDYVLR